MSRKTKLKKMPLATVPDCIFCGKPANSREHAFPEWLIDTMEDWYAERFGPKDPRIPPIWECIDGVGSKSEIRLENLEIVIKCVCKKCNEGWMSEIQNNHAKPVITRILEEGSHTLGRQDYTSLTIWSVMTAMVLDIRNHPDQRRFVQEENVSFWYKHKNIFNNFMQENIYVPQGFRVWLARWKNSTGPSVHGRLLSNTGSPEKGVVNTIGFGTLIFQIVRTPPDIELGGRSGPWDRSLVQIFPPPGGEVAFPPPQGIDGYDGLEEVDMRFSPPGADTGRPSDDEYRRTGDIVSSILQRSGESPPA
jgi:hypothetical protein